MSERDLVEDMIDAIVKIQEYTFNMDASGFVIDTLTFDAVVRNLEVLGEAAGKIPKSISDNYPEIAWSKIVVMRNKMIHEYFGVDPDIVWMTVQDDLPGLLKDLKRILS